MKPKPSAFSSFPHAMQRGLAGLLLLSLMLAGLLPMPTRAAAQGGEANGENALQGEGVRVVTGEFATSNPLYTQMGAEIGAALYELSGRVELDYDFRSPPEAQVLGEIEGDIAGGTYRITLPAAPRATPQDFDGDPDSPPAVQVYGSAIFINIRGDEYLNRGETPFQMSANFDSMTYRITGGNLLVWAQQAGEAFPSGRGADDLLFTDDDPLMTLGAGWSAVNVDAEPFRVMRNPEVTLPIVESSARLHDYGDLPYDDAWQQLFQRARETYPFTDIKNLDWDAIYAEITPLVTRVDSDLEFHLVMARFGMMIPDSHISYESVPVTAQYLLGGVGVGQVVVADDGQVVLGYVAPNQPAGGAGLRSGDLLLEIDGEPALEALNTTPLLFASASTPHARQRLQGALMLTGPVQSRVEVTWQNKAGEVFTSTLTRVPDLTPWIFLGGSGGANLIQSKLLDSGLGYIYVRDFAQQVSDADALFSQALQALVDAGATGIIIDLRNNPGGLVNLSMSMLGHFFDDYERMWDFYYADGEGNFAYRGFAEILVSEPYYDGPIAVLVNESTASMGDLFAYTVQRSGRGIVVGHTPTNGAAGEVSDGRYLLPGDLNMQIPTGRPIDPVTGQTLLEGTGVVPDILVPRTVENIRSPEDEVLAAAQQALLGQ